MGYGAARDRVEKIKSNAPFSCEIPEIDSALSSEMLFYKGLQFYLAIGERQDFQSAFFYFKVSAAENLSAQFFLGRMHANGHGVTQDDVQAAAWFRLAAEQGNAVAQYSLGCRYREGRGVPQDDVQAVAWFRRAAEQGLASGQHTLGLRYLNGQGITQDDVQAAAWFRRAAEQGHASGQYNLGLMYKEGQGVPQDDGQAVAWYRRAAEQGHARAMNNLGGMYLNGQGIAQDDIQAVAWFRRAAEQGLATGQYNLGLMYLQGHGISQDGAQAAPWFRRAAEQGHADAKRNLNGMYQEGRVPLRSEDCVIYRRDHEKNHIENALLALETLAKAGDFRAHYHLAGKSAKALDLAKTFPNDFWEELQRDPFLNEKEKCLRAEHLWEMHHRQRMILESQASFNVRPRLNDENYIQVCFYIAKYDYAHFREITGEKIERMLKFLSLVPEGHENYDEAQFISAHLNSMKNPEGEEWKLQLNNSGQADIKPEICVLKEALISHSKRDSSQQKKFRQEAFARVGQFSKSFEPLLRLSILTEKPKKRAHYLRSLKAVDEDFAQSQKWLEYLRVEKAITPEIQQSLLDEMEHLRLPA